MTKSIQDQLFLKILRKSEIIRASQQTITNRSEKKNWWKEKERESMKLEL